MRTKAEVAAAQRTVAGCCPAYRLYRPCRCLDDAAPDAVSWGVTAGELDFLRERLAAAGWAVLGDDDPLAFACHAAADRLADLSVLLRQREG